MKKSSKKNSKKAAAQQQQMPEKRSNILKEKSSIIVLVIAAVIFFALFFWIYKEDFMKDSADIFWVYGDELVEFEKAKVEKITKEEMEPDEVAENKYAGSQKLGVTVNTGRYKGENMVAYNYFGPLYGVPVEVGDYVTLTIKTHNDGEVSATVYEFHRITILAFFMIIFFILVCIVGRLTGLKSLIGLVFTFLCLFVLLIPLVIKGAPSILTTFIMCAYIALVSFTILGGIHRKTMSAFLGTVSGAFLAMVFGLAVQHFAKIDGYRLSDAEPLLQLKYVDPTLNIGISGLLVAGIIISALGAVMDVAMSISSSLEEIHAANPALKRNELFKSGMNIGRDMVGTMTNTLILAFLGGQFTLMIFLYARDLTFYHLFSTALVAIETISGISASIGMVLAIPLTAFISSTLITRK